MDIAKPEQHAGERCVFSDRVKTTAERFNESKTYTTRDQGPGHAFTPSGLQVFAPATRRLARAVPATSPAHRASERTAVSICSAGVFP